jgi:hypothetical protein
MWLLHDIVPPFLPVSVFAIIAILTMDEQTYLDPAEYDLVQNRDTTWANAGVLALHRSQINAQFCGYYFATSW